MNNSSCQWLTGHCGQTQCVLHWMKSHKPLPVFVQNRLKEIKSHKNIKFRYVTTTQNPADLATRGVSTEELINNQLWWHGPSWLSDNATKWPSWAFQQIDDNTVEQIAKQAVRPQIMNETSALIEMENKREPSEKPVAPFELNETNYSSLTRLLRVTAWTLSFIQKLQKKSTQKEELKAEEIDQAKLMWERQIQNSNFLSEINATKTNTRNNLKNQLGLKMDENGILHCHGRLMRENLPESTVFPKLLPKNHAFTSLLINSFHEKLMHAGVSHTLLLKPLNNPLSVSPSKGKQGTTRGKEKIFRPRRESNPRTTGWKIFSLPCVVHCFPLLGLTLSGLFKGLSSTLICTSELILCSAICVPSATRHNIYMYPYFLFAVVHHLKSPPTFSVRPCSSVGRVTVGLIRRSWVRFLPRLKDFFLCLVWFPVSLY